MYEELAERTTPRGHSAIDALDEELDILEKTIELLRHRIDPVISRYDAERAVAEEKEIVPASAIRERTERVRRVRSRVERMIEGLDI